MLIHGVELVERDDMVIAHQRRTGKPFEAASVAVWCEAARGVVVDIGAYSGLYAILAAQRGAEVYAFEPSELAYRRLQLNAERNGVQLTARHAAVGERVGRAALHTASRVKMTSAGRIGPGNEVDLITLDSLQLDGVGAIKIDVEGAECQVLRGALATLHRCRPLLITEALTPAARRAQEDQLAPLGYVAEPVDEWNLIWRP